MSYNGWMNYETWNVALWIDNEQGSYAERCEMAQQAWDETDESDSVEERISEATATFAKRIQSWVEETNPLAGQASMFADILGAALSEVSWYEIAGNWLEDVDKPEPETEPEEETKS